jgi:membrane protease YdiL (CAAX protease family)
MNDELSLRSQATNLVAPGERALLLWEMASVVSSALIAEWVVLALTDWKLALVVPVGLACVLMLAAKQAHGETRRQLGLRGDNFGRACRLLVLPMVGSTILLLLAGRFWFGVAPTIGRGRAGWALLGVPVWGFVWGLFQQYALQAFINRRLQMFWGTGWHTTLVVAALFALLHLPNPWLMAATFLGGLIWAAVYQRAPNLWALALSHAVMTWVLVSTLPAAALGGLRVGYKYFG